MSDWTEDRKRVERAILELVRLSQERRAERNDAAANAYERAIRILRRQFHGQIGPSETKEA